MSWSPCFARSTAHRHLDGDEGRHTGHHDYHRQHVASGLIVVACGDCSTSHGIHAATVASFKQQAAQVTVSQVVNNPANYNGSRHHVPGDDQQVPPGRAGVTKAMNVTDPNDLSSVLYVQLSPGADPTRMNKQDTITISGFGAGSLTAKNAFGSIIHAPAASEIYLSFG